MVGRAVVSPFAGRDPFEVLAGIEFRDAPVPVAGDPLPFLAGGMALAALAWWDRYKQGQADASDLARWADDGGAW